MGLSGLNAHRFTYNLIDSPTCTLCSRGNETTLHYLWECTSHEVARQTMLARLKAETSTEQITKDNIAQIVINGEIELTNHKTLFIIISQFLTDTKRFK
jgi:hypothetical protein